VQHLLGRAGERVDHIIIVSARSMVVSTAAAAGSSIIIGRTSHFSGIVNNVATSAIIIAATTVRRDSSRFQPPSQPDQSTVGQVEVTFGHVETSEGLGLVRRAEEGFGFR